MSQKLEFDGINLAFGGLNLLSNIYMCCEVGKITGLLGRNGSGKTTLMKIVFGVIAAESKSVRIDAQYLGYDYISRNLITYLPQQNLIPAFISIRKALSLFNIPEDAITLLFPETHDMMDLKPGELSGGYRRILEVLLILKSKATFCLLDEPFSGLMPLHIDRLKEIMHVEKSNKGIIITDHLHQHVTHIAERLYLLVNGQTYIVKDKNQLIALGYVNAS